MDKQQKKVFVEELHGRLEKVQGAFLVDYKGLDVETLNRLRNELRDAGIEFQVVKNRLLKLACEETQTVSIKDRMTGPTAIALAYEDVVASAKVLVNFAKTNKNLEIKHGQVSGRALEGKDIVRLSELPGREVLLAQALSGMQAVPASFVRVLGGVLSAIEKQKTASA